MELLRSVVLRVELVIGSDISDAASDMCALASRLGLVVEANFNTVVVLASPNDKPEYLVDAYHVQLTRGITWKPARASDPN